MTEPLTLLQLLAISVAEIRIIHRRNNGFPYYCVNCRAPYPCRTIQALPAVDEPAHPHATPEPTP